MSALVSLRDAVVADLRANLPGLKSVEPHGGTFDLKEIKRHAIEAPCARVVVVGVGEIHRHSSGGFLTPVNIAVVIVTRDSAAEGVGIQSRDKAGLALCTAVSMLVAGHRFNLEGVEPPDDLKSTNEFSGPLDELGVALWQVTWTQAVLVPRDTLDDTIAELSQIWINDTEFTEGAEPANASPLGNPIETPAPGLPAGPQPGDEGGSGHRDGDPR